MLSLVVTLICLILLTTTGANSDASCNPSWLDCGNGKCVSEIWHCDGDNDCGNFKDEENCERPVAENECLSSQFACATDKHCIPERWHCDGEKDCEDGSDEVRCDNVTEKCTGFTCRDHHCIPAKWQCDGNKDCSDGSDEESCPQGKLCTDLEFLCASGSCINQSLVCDKHKDCVDGSDEGLHCGDPCENATCSQNCRATPEGPQCYCNDGYILESKDNKTCTDIDECQQEGFCSHECTNTAGSYKCSCKSGYELVNRTCKAKGADPLLVFTTLHEIRAMYLHTQKYFLVRRASARASAVDVDPKSKRIYWLEISNRSSIYSSNIEGSDYKTVLSHGLIVPEDIAVDYIANNLYITDSGLKQVLACKTDGSMCTVLHDQNVGKPRSIALDHTEGFLYWSDWGERTAGIYRSGMDGSHKIPLVTTDIAWPNGIAIDHSTKRLYWADAKLKRVEYISLNGNSRKVIYNETVFHPYAVTVFEDTIYWSDWSEFSLESCNKFTGHDVRLIARENGVHIMGVHIYHPLLTATVPNPCWSSECSHMCLISPVSGFHCACSHGFKLGKDGKTCTIEERSESIFVSEGSRIYYIIPKAVGSGVITEMPLQIRSTISRVSYDRNLHCLYVADVDTPAIHVINMSSLHMRVLVKSNLTTPQDLAFDSRSNNLYWVDAGKGTVEVISIDSLKRVVLIKNLNRPAALAIAPEKGVMFIAMIGMHPSVMKCGMDGKNGVVLHSIQGMAVSLALHPSKSILYWADPRSGTISYRDYENSRYSKILVREAYDAMSVAASEEYIYWTSTRRELNLRKGNVTHVLPLPGQKGALIRRVTYSPATISAGKSECLIGNGGCSYLCLTSQRGRTCACPPDLILDHDNASCVARRCEENDFKCVNGQCVPPGLRCDGNNDCDDGSDEVNCGSRCSGDDFQCKNGRCILKSWLCDKRNDCEDNSDEENCPLSSACTKDQLACLNGECVPVLWRCDGERDCSDGSDEQNCNLTRCDSTDHYRCESGRCIPISWVCDGTEDCHDKSDEKNCSKACALHEFTCESDGSCLDEMLRCDGRADCFDGSDEKNCPRSHSNCEDKMYRCIDGACIYDYEVCDGHGDCANNEDESNCTHAVCQEDEMLCPSSKRCIIKKWICDGDADCNDESDEQNCDQPRSTQKPKLTSPPVTDTTCEAFGCYVTGKCLPWNKVCDGHKDCADSSDEGQQCSRACRKNGGCSHICQKLPYGPKCFCNEGYRLLPDNKTCGDINECEVLGTCSHFCNNTKGSFKCSCAEGYTLQHRHCKADGPATLVYLLGNQIRGFDLHSNSTHVIVNVTNVDMLGMDYDASSAIFFWTERNDESINFYSPKSRKRDVHVRSSLRPTYIRYDWITGNLYVKDASSSIMVCTKDVKYCKTLIKPSKTLIYSIDILPSAGLMFWTVWANEKQNQVSGLIERAEMDGSHRLTIVSDKTIAPSAITVDRILNRIYWTDKQLSTLECADFHGLQRRQVVQSGMYHPMAVGVFEDNVYWADWGTDSIMRCNKFTGQQCANVTESNVKAQILVIVHKEMQPQVANRCLDANCSQLCILTRSDSVCACDDTDKDSCDVKSEMISPLSMVNCPDCHGQGKCIVNNRGEYTCKCMPPYYGTYCESKVDVAASNYDSSWIVAVVLAIMIAAVMILSIVMCIRNREKLHKVGESVSVKFLNPKSHRDSRLVMDTDDVNMYDELVIEQDADCKKARGNSDYTNSEAEESDLKRWPSARSDFTFNTIGNFFRKLKLNATMLS